MAVQRQVVVPWNYNLDVVGLFPNPRRESDNFSKGAVIGKVTRVEENIPARQFTKFFVFIMCVYKVG